MPTLDEGRWQSMERIAQHVANTHPARSSSSLTMSERFDAALNAVVQYVADFGWPESDFGDMFRFAVNSVKRDMHEVDKHLRHWSYWHTPPAPVDALADAVAERIGVQQLCWAFSPGEWEVVSALAAAIGKGGDYHQAAASLGLSDAAFKAALYRTRKRAFQLWIPPDEHPAGRYQPMKRESRSSLHHNLNWRRSRKAA